MCVCARERETEKGGGEERKRKKERETHWNMDDFVTFSSELLNTFKESDTGLPLTYLLAMPRSFQPTGANSVGRKPDRRWRLPLATTISEWHCLFRLLDWMFWSNTAGVIEIDWTNHCAVRFSYLPLHPASLLSCSWRLEKTLDCSKFWRCASEVRNTGVGVGVGLGSWLENVKLILLTSCAELGLGSSCWYLGFTSTAGTTCCYCVMLHILVFPLCKWNMCVFQLF